MKKILVLILLFSSLNSFADVSIQMYLSDKNGSSFDDYITGVGKGIFWSNISMDIKFQKRLYCSPSKLILNGINYRQILDAQIKKMNRNDDDKNYIEGVLLLGLVNTFPCN